MPLAFLTGATGFVGSHVADELIARGWRVRCSMRRTSDMRWLAGKPHEPASVALTDVAALTRAMEGADAVFHVAGLLTASTLTGYRAGNWLVPKRMIEAAVAARVPRFVQVSSIAAAGPSRNGAVDETTAPAPVSMYGRSKLEGEREVWARRDRIGVTVVRPPAVYGPRDRGLLDLFRAAAAGVVPRIGGPKRVSLVHVADLARGIVDGGTSARAAGETFYLANERAYLMAELVEMIRAAAERRALLTVAVPDRVVRLLGWVAESVLPLVGKASLFSYDKALEMTQAFWVCSPAKARRLLAWEARVPVEKGLRDTLLWYREQRWLR